MKYHAAFIGVIFIVVLAAMLAICLHERIPGTQDTSTYGTPINEGSGLANADVAVYNAGILAMVKTPDIRKAKPLRLSEDFPIAMAFGGIRGHKGNELERIIASADPFPIIHAPGKKDKCLIVRRRWPNKIITIQDAYGGSMSTPLEEVWPGHCLYKAGALLSRDCSEKDTLLSVDQTSKIVRRPGAIHSRKGKSGKMRFYLILYALDEQGKPDWARSERLELTGLEKGQLVVKRGMLGTKPLAFKAGQAVVASHMMFWGGQWQFNFSLHCPRGGPDNLTAAQWYARVIANRVAQCKVDGVEFDVGRWTWGHPERNPMDCNNDLVPDYGYINGICSFGLGGRVFFRELRRILGPNKIIQVDSNGATSLRGWDYLNGVQLECFPSKNHFERFSEVFLHLRRWSEQAKALPRFSYGFTKAPTTVFSNAYLPDGSKTDFRFRVGLAANCMVGMPHPFASMNTTDFDPANDANKKTTVTIKGIYKWDEYHGGDLNDWQWLGKPLGPAKQYLDDLDDTDLLAGATWQWKTDTGFEAQCETSDTGGTANVKHIPEPKMPLDRWYGVRLELSPKQKLSFEPGREYTIEFDIRGDDRWNYRGQVFERVPRAVVLRGIGEGLVAASVNAESKWVTCRIAMIAHPKAEPGLAFGVSEQIGQTQIRNIKLYAGGCERWSRDFEGGKVLLNMTKKPWRLDIGSGYRRLKGKQCPDINNGQKIEGIIEIPAWDAVFLVRIK